MVAEHMIAGEWALDGRVRPIKGALSMAMLARGQESVKQAVTVAAARGHDTLLIGPSASKTLN